MYKVAILGYRQQGKLHHAPAFARNPDCEIVAVCDIVEERAREGAETYGVPAYLDADEMLEKEEIDIVDIRCYRRVAKGHCWPSAPCRVRRLTSPCPPPLRTTHTPFGVSGSSLLQLIELTHLV